MKNPKTAYTTIWLAIAFTIACKELARHTGVAATDWSKELRRRAFDKLQKYSDNQISKYIAENFDYE